MARARPIVWLCLLATAALGLRLWHVSALSHSLIGDILIGDPLQYVEWARRITAGDWVGSAVFYQTPLYPYLLALAFAVAGPSIEVVRILQAIGGTAATLLVAWAGSRFFGWPAGLVAGALLAIYPAAIFFDGLLQKSSLDLLLMTALLASIAETIDRPRRRWVIVMGLALGCLLINRESARLFYPLLLAWLLTRPALDRRRRAGMAVLLTAATLVPVVPVAVRNYVVGGEWVVSTSQLGSTFYIGNRRGATGLYVPLVPERGSAEFERIDATRLAREALGRDLTAGEVSDYWLDLAVRDITTDPVSWLALLARKTHLVLNAAEAMDTESRSFHADYSPVLRGLAWFDYGLLLPLAVFGVWLTAGEWRRTWVLVGLVVLTLAAAALFIVIERYRFPAAPVLMLFAGAGLVRLGRWRRIGAGGRAGCAVTVAAAAVVANVPLAMPADASYANAGAELLRQGRPEQAVTLLEASVASSPDYARTYYDLAHAYDEAGRAEDAVRTLRALIDLAPSEAESRRVLAVTLLQMGRHEDAVRAAKDAAELAPASPSVLQTLGTVLGAAGETEAAADVYRRVLAIDPRYVTSLNNLANLLAASGDPAAALVLYRQAVEIEPSYAEARTNFATALEQSGRPDEAIAQMRRALELRPDNVQMHVVFGDLLLRHGHRADARKVLESGLRLAGADSRADVSLRVRLASVNLSEGRSHDARVLLHDALDIARASSQTAIATEIEETIRTMGR